MQQASDNEDERKFRASGQEAAWRKNKQDTDFSLSHWVEIEDSNRI